MIVLSDFFYLFIFEKHMMKPHRKTNSPAILSSSNSPQEISQVIKTALFFTAFNVTTIMIQLSYLKHLKSNSELFNLSKKKSPFLIQFYGFKKMCKVSILQCTLHWSFEITATNVKRALRSVQQSSISNPNYPRTVFPI